MRADAAFCSGRCRVAAHRSKRTAPAHGLPVELVERNRWVRYSSRKIPLTAESTVGSSTNPSTWCDYDTAAASDAGVGLGFVLNGDGIVCIDIDHCIVDGVISAEAKAIVNACHGTYVEVSPSGNGLHIWGTARLRYRGRKFNNGVEVYGDARYITVTGNAVGPSRQLAPIGKVISTL